MDVAFPFSLNAPKQQICLFYCPVLVFILLGELCSSLTASLEHNIPLTGGQKQLQPATSAGVIEGLRRRSVRGNIFESQPGGRTRLQLCAEAGFTPPQLPAMAGLSHTHGRDVLWRQLSSVR